MACSLAPPAMRITAVISRPGLVTCPIAACISSAAIAWSCRGIDLQRRHRLRFVGDAVGGAAESCAPSRAAPGTFSALRTTGSAPPAGIAADLRLDPVLDLGADRRGGNELARAVEHLRHHCVERDDRALAVRQPHVDQLGGDVAIAARSRPRRPRPRTIAPGDDKRARAVLDDQASSMPKNGARRSAFKRAAPARLSAGGRLSESLSSWCPGCRNVSPAPYRAMVNKASRGGLSRTEEFVTIQPAAGSRQAWPVRV